jgi:hypothetical protein
VKAEQFLDGRRQLFFFACKSGCEPKVFVIARFIVQNGEKV